MPTRRKKHVIFVDAFAGCGGLSLGLMQAGCTGLLAIEKDSFAFETLKSNLLRAEGRFSFMWPDWLPKEPVSIDTLLVRHSKNLAAIAGSVDLLVGGPPCQGFSERWQAQAATTPKRNR